MLMLDMLYVIALKYNWYDIVILFLPFAEQHKLNIYT